jgi:hypothetical protein
MSYGAVREMLSQMVKAGRPKTSGVDNTLHPDYKEHP